jgi:hypothetical protein
MKVRCAVYSLLFIFLLFSCGAPETSGQRALSLHKKYRGTWQRVSGKEKTLNIYEKEGGLFIKYPNGSTYPLKYENEGHYYYAVTPLGHVPLLLEGGILTINNGYPFTYRRQEP